MNKLLKVIGRVLLALIAIISISILCLPLINKLFWSYGDPFHDPKNWEVGGNGEPPVVHQEDYNKKYTVLYADYLKAMDIVFNFSNKKGFNTIRFGECFKDALKYRRDGESLPCGAVYFEKGTPTKYLARIIITEKQVLGCMYSGPNYVVLNVVMTSSGDAALAVDFAKNYESRFEKLEAEYKNVREGWSESSCHGV